MMMRPVMPSEDIKTFLPQFSLVLRGLNDAHQVIPSFKSKEICSLTLSHSPWEGWDLSAKFV